MSRPTWTDEEQHLADVLQHEAGEAVPNPDGWAAITARTADARAVDDLAARREQRRHRRQGFAAGAVATGMVAATVVFALGGGLHRDPAPSAPTAPSSPNPSLAGFNPSSPRSTWTVYRAGADALYSDEVRASDPYDPAQAFTALFSRRSATAGPLGVEANGRNRVASVRSGPTGIVLDLDAADTVTDGRSPRTAGLEAQAWVATANAAFNSGDLPLTVTLHGKPFRLLGVLDTASPIKASGDVRTVSTPRLFLPEVGARVTSPVDIVANPGAGDYDYVVRDEATGKQVWSNTVGQQEAGTVGVTADLPAGSYEIVVSPGGDRPAGSRRNLFQSDFVVTGPAPAPTRTPVTNPATTDVPRVAVTWPERDGSGLVEEWRPRASVAQVLADLADGPVRGTTPVLRPWRGAALTAPVTAGTDRVVVDLATAPSSRAPDQATAHRWALTLVRAVDDVLLTDLPVQFTVRGKPVELFAQLDTSSPLSRAGTVTVSAQPEVFAPTEGRWSTGEAVVVGAGSPGGRSVTWYVIDPVSNETLYQGRAALDDEHTYGFRLPLPAGSYLLEVHLDKPARTTAYDLDVL